jgi:pimeloyl-ACP methyl ester carboxylesterase
VEPSDFEHGKLDVGDVRLHYVTAGSGDPLVLLHGFPQTWWEWRRVIEPLAQRFHVIAPDYRGAGSSSRPVTGYDKRTMAGDVRALVREVAGDGPVRMVGHDMGSFVAFAYAAHYRDEVAKLVLIDAPVVGTEAWDALLRNPRVWHIGFHGARDVAEMLVAGRERAYLEQFFDARAYLDDAITEQDVDIYVRSYRAPGAMRAAFEAYRALPGDAEVNRGLLAEGPLPMPLLLVGGALSNSGPLMEATAAEVAPDAETHVMARAGHWIPEEQPQELLKLLERFL